MSSLHSPIKTFVIHFSPLQNRLRAQKSSFTWHLLCPELVTESCCGNESSIYPFPGEMSVDNKIEIVAQCHEILHVLSVHSRALHVGNLAIDSADSTDTKHGFCIKAAKQYYLQAIYAYSQKNYELTLQHLKAMRLFVGTGKDYCLIIEDDSMPLPEVSALDFSRELESCLTKVCKLRSGYFDISNSFGFHASGANPSNRSLDPAFISMAPGQTRCASAYILSRDAAETILSRSQPIVLPVDWHISSILARTSFPTYWYSRPIFTQGSQCGLFESNQSIRNCDVSLRTRSQDASTGVEYLQ